MGSSACFWAVRSAAGPGANVVAEGVAGVGSVAAMSRDDLPAGGTVEATAEFTIDLQPGTPELDSTGRFDFTKIWTGEIAGTSRGLMLSAGDPSSGDAGYVALETFDGTIDGQHGTVALQQFGTMRHGDTVLRYDLVPGSGTGGLVGISGTIELRVTEGTHQVFLRYSRP